MNNGNKILGDDIMPPDDLAKYAKRLAQLEARLGPGGAGNSAIQNSAHEKEEGPVSASTQGDTK